MRRASDHGAHSEALVPCTSENEVCANHTRCTARAPRPMKSTHNQRFVLHSALLLQTIGCFSCTRLRVQRLFWRVLVRFGAFILCHVTGRPPRPLFAFRFGHIQYALHSAFAFFFSRVVKVSRAAHLRELRKGGYPIHTIEKKITLTPPLPAARYHHRLHRSSSTSHARKPPPP